MFFKAVVLIQQIKYKLSVLGENNSAKVSKYVYMIIAGCSDLSCVMWDEICAVKTVNSGTMGCRFATTFLHKDLE